MDYGLLAKVIIRNLGSQESLEAQISSFHHQELRKIIWNVFKETETSSVTLLIKSVSPYYKILLGGTKHIIEIFKTPKYFRAWQKDDKTRDVIDPDTAEESLNHYRTYQIASLTDGFQAPLFCKYLAYQDENYMIFLNEKMIRRKLYRFKFYHDQYNILEHVKAINPWTVKRIGDYLTLYQRLTLNKSDNEEYDDDQDDDFGKHDFASHWLENIDDIGISNLENQMEP